jgi:hypothetical protein
LEIKTISISCSSLIFFNIRKANLNLFRVVLSVKEEYERANKLVEVSQKSNESSFAAILLRDNVHGPSYWKAIL